MKFKTQYDKHDRVYTNAGDHVKITYSPKLGDDGTLDLYPTGKIDLYDEIQSHAESVDINVILARYANGDDSALNRVAGVYLDTTDMPRTFAEWNQRLIDCQNYFESLPLDTRALFDHDVNKFIASIGTEKFAEVFSKAEPDLVQPVSDVVKKEEKKEGVEVDA